MTTPIVGVVATDWINDPIAIRVGPKTVALVLVLAARALADQYAGERDVVVALDVWSCYLNRLETDRVVAAGLVEPLLVGRRPVAFRIAPWVRSRIDTNRKIQVRDQTRDRVRRLRDRKKEQPSLDLWETCGEPIGFPDPDVTVTCVTSDPKIGPGSISARAEVRTTYLADLFGVHSAQCKSGAVLPANAPVENSDPSKTFRLLMAVAVGVRQTRREWVHPTSSIDRRDLVDAVRSAAERAHLQTPTDREIRRAIRYVERNDVDLSRTGGPS